MLQLLLLLPLPGACLCAAADAAAAGGAPAGVMAGVPRPSPKKKTHAQTEDNSCLPAVHSVFIYRYTAYLPKGLQEPLLRLLLGARAGGRRLLSL